MKQILLKTWLILVCLLTGAGTMWAETKTLTLDKLGSGLGSTSNETMSTVNITATGTSDAYTLNYLQGKKQGDAILLAKSTGAFIANSTAMPGDIKSVTVYINSGASSKTTYHCAFTSTACTEAITTGSTAVNITGGNSNKYTCSAGGNKYFCVSLGNANNGQVLKLEVEYEVSGGTTPETPTVAAPTFSPAAGTYTGAQTITLTQNDASMIMYTTDGTDPSYENEVGETYDAPFQISSSCTVKAIAIDDKGNESKVASAEYTIKLDPTNTQETAYTVEQAKAIIDNSAYDLTKKVYVKGTVSEIVTPWNDQYNNITYNISEDGATTGSQFQLFRCATNGAEVGDNVIAYGTLTKYSSTYELTTGNTIVDIQKPAQKTITALAVSGTPTKTTYNVGDAFETAGLVVTATYSDETTAPITTGFDWEIDYGTGNDALVAGATSVGVMVYTEDNVMSEVYTVEGLTVTVPVTLTSIAVSGTPTKTSYYVGDAFETAGLVVTGSYSDSHQEVITDGIEWTVNPETLTLGTTSVEVKAGVGEVVSEVYTVEGLTVTKPDFETVTYDFSEFTSGTSVELTDLDGFVITLAKGDGITNPAWNAGASEARVYAKGSLTVKANNAIIKSIEYEYTVNANSKGVTPTIDSVAGTTTAGTWDAENKTWTGADEEVTFSTSGTAGNIGFTKLIIKYTAGTKTTPTLSFSAPTAEVTIGADDNVFPTLTTTPADLAGVTYESSNTAIATVDENTGVVTLVAAGETTITANYAGNENYSAATPASYTLTVVKAPFVPTPAADGYETIDFAALYSSVTTNATVEDYEGTSFAMAFAKPQSSSTPTKYYDNGKAVRAYEGNTITITAAEPIQYVGINWTVEDEEVSIVGLGTTTAVVTVSKTCRFTAITVDYVADKYTRNVTDGNFGTICLPYATSNVEGATIYNIVGVKKDGEAITGIVIEEAEENLIAGKPYIFKATGATLTAQYSGIRATEAAEAKGLVGNLTNNKVTVEATGTNYVIGNDNKIHKVVTGGTGVTIGANRAYLNLAGVGLYNPYEAESTRAIFFGLDGTVKDEWGTPTGIESVETTTDSTIYNLQGQRVNRAQKGVYVVNGRKVIR